jgi:2'-5' RNA ligase
MAQTTRTFVAVPIPEAKAEKLGRLQTLVAPEIPRARWGEPKHLHLTLAFLGDVDNTDLNKVCLAVQDVVAGFAPLELRLEGLGVFPNPRRPRTVWAGLAGPGLETLHAIQQAVVRGVRSAGFPPADDRFSPHVTLGRLKPGRGPVSDVTSLVRQYAGWSAGAFTVSEIVTFASNPTSEGPSYTALATAVLTGGKNRSRA